MSGTKAGGVKAAQTNKERHGNDFFRRIGKIGGKNGHTGGFASMPRERVAECGRIGGMRSRRGKAKNWSYGYF